MLITFI